MVDQPLLGDTSKMPTETIAPDLLERISDCVKRAAEPKSIVLDEAGLTANLFDGGMLDSFGWINLLDELDEAFGIELDLDELDQKNIVSVRDIAGHINTLLKTR